MMLTKTALSVELCLINGRIPDNSRLVCDRVVVDDNHPIGAALIQNTKTGIYALYNAPGVISSVDQRQAEQIDGMSN